MIGACKWSKCNWARCAQSLESKLWILFISFTFGNLLPNYCWSASVPIAATFEVCRTMYRFELRLEYWDWYERPITGIAHNGGQCNNSTDSGKVTFKEAPKSYIYRFRVLLIHGHMSSVRSPPTFAFRFWQPITKHPFLRTFRVSSSGASFYRMESDSVRMPSNGVTIHTVKEIIATNKTLPSELYSILTHLQHLTSDRCRAQL